MRPRRPARVLVPVAALSAVLTAAVPGAAAAAPWSAPARGSPAYIARDIAGVGCR